MSARSSTQLRHLFDIMSGATPESGNSDYWDGDIAWVTPEDVGQVEGRVLLDTRRKLTAEGYANCGAKVARAGSIVLTKRAPIGQLALLSLDACSNQGCFLLSPREGVEPRYFYYVLASNVPLLQALGRGSTFMELSTDDLKALRVPLLEYGRQVAIANFLDEATAKIDGLLRSKHSLLELLAEKRKAIVASAVARGLAPNAKLRDAGAPWLGRIPAHWNLARLKFVARVQTGIALGKNYGGQATIELPYLRVANVQDGFIDISDVKTMFVPEREAASATLRRGDVLMNEGGDADKLGRGAIWSGAIEPCLHQNHVFALRPTLVSSEWLATWTASEFAKAYFETRAKQSTNLASISATNLLELPIAVPPMSEQKAIVEHISGETARLDKVRVATERTIALLRERRSALMAAAVTGQFVVAGVS